MLSIPYGILTDHVTSQRTQRPVWDAQRPVGDTQRPLWDAGFQIADWRLLTTKKHLFLVGEVPN